MKFKTLCEGKRFVMARMETLSVRARNCDSVTPLLLLDYVEGGKKEKKVK